MSSRQLSLGEQTAYDRGFREGVQLVLDYASRSATTIEASSRRQVHEGFAVAALRGLVEACLTLLKLEDERRTA